MSLYNMVFGRNEGAAQLLYMARIDPDTVPRLRDVELAVAVGERVPGGTWRCR